MKSLAKLVHLLLLPSCLISLPSLTAAAEDPALIWQFQADGAIFSAPAIGPNGEIVFCTEVEVSDLAGDGTVYSLNPDGSENWRFEDGGDYFDSSPTIADDGTIYAGCWDGFLYAIDGEDGSQLWKFETQGLIVASPAIGPDGTIYIGSYDGYLYAINPNGTEKWVYEPALGLSNEVQDLSPINGSPVLNKSGNTVYFGNDNGNLYAIETSSGIRDWVYFIPDSIFNNPVTSAPAIGEDGTIYVSSENGFLYAVNPSGNLKWKFAASDSIRSSPIIDESGNIYCTSRDGYLYAISPLGSGIWASFVGDVFYCTPALDAEGNIVVAAYTGLIDSEPWSSVVAIDPDGELLWEFDFSGYNDSSPNIAPDGSIYIGAYNGNLYRLQGSSPLAREGWPRHQGNRRQTGWWEDLQDQDMIDLFPSIASSADGWSYVPWFGSGWISEIEVPWILHEEHGFLYVLPEGPESVYFWDTRLEEWFYFSSSQQDFIYRTEWDSWLYYSPLYSDESGRWFYDFTLPSWLQVPYF